MAMSKKDEECREADADQRWKDLRINKKIIK